MDAVNDENKIWTNIFEDVVTRVCTLNFQISNFQISFFVLWCLIWGCKVNFMFFEFSQLGEKLDLEKFSVDTRKVEVYS